MNRNSLFLVVLACALASAQNGGTTPSQTFHGWLSDAKCSRSRAASGLYTGTNPTCAKECVAGGAKIVLILPKEKKILDIENQDVARANLGNLVEVLGTTDARGKTIHIAALRLLEEGIAACERPKLSK